MEFHKSFFIAEAGVNHNGSMDRAKELIGIAKQAKADAVKFQSFNVERLVTKQVATAAYQKENTGTKNQAELLHRLALSEPQMVELKQCCEDVGIEFMSTPFDPLTLRYLVDDLGMKRIKIPSGEAINGPLLLAAIRSSAPIILSTGMCTLDEIMESLSVLVWGVQYESGVPSSRAELAEIRRSANWLDGLKKRVWLMHCVTQYPAPVEVTNLQSIDLMRDTTGLPVGLSDHSLGCHVALAAVARGACAIEKHFTLSRTLQGPDHKASLEPAELRALVTQIRDVEMALGEYQKQPSKAEMNNALIARGVLVAAKDIHAGEELTSENITIKRAGVGISAYDYWDFINGKIANADFLKDDVIDRQSVYGSF